MPSPKNASTIRALHYLRRQAKSSQLFTADQLAVASGWSLSSVKTYLSKKLGQLVEKTERGYRVKPEVLRLSDAQFLSHMTQVKPVFTDYRRTKHDHLLTYEFLLPLTREDKLRQSLDELFFTDTIRRRITEIGPESLRALVHTSRPLGKKALLAALIDRVSSIAGGYSISHTSGRFRVCRPGIQRGSWATVRTGGSIPDRRDDCSRQVSSSPEAGGGGTAR